MIAPKRPWAIEFLMCKQLPVNEAISRVHFVSELRHKIVRVARTNAFQVIFREIYQVPHVRTSGTDLMMLQPYNTVGWPSYRGMALLPWHGSPTLGRQAYRGMASLPWGGSKPEVTVTNQS